MIISYSKGDTPLHRLNPLSKLAAVFAACTALFLFAGAVYVLCGLAVVLGLAYFMGLGNVAAVVRTRFASILGLWLIFANAVFTSQGRVLLVVPLYFFHIKVTDWGLLLGIMYAARFLTVFLIGALFIATTEPAALVYSLMRRGLPYRYGFLLVLMLRFVPVFERERKTVSDAQKMRGLEIDKRSLKKLYRSLRFTLVPLIVSALSKVDSLVISMEGRAFGFKPIRTFTIEDRYSTQDRILTAASLAAVAVLLAGRAFGWRFLRGPMF